LRGIRWACTIGAGQAPSEAPCVPIRGTPASRRSHRGDFGRRGRASPHRHCGRIGHSELPHPGRSARRGAPASRGDGCESPPQDATPRSVLRIVSRARPLMSKAENLCSNVANRSQVLNTRCAGASMSGPTQQARVRPKWWKSQYKFSPQPPGDCMRSELWREQYVDKRSLHAGRAMNVMRALL
jgi:hypothetical protein